MALNEMAEHGIPELGLKPSALRGHYSTRVRNGHQFVNARREHRKGARVSAAVHLFLQLARPSDSPHEIDPLTRAGIVDAKNRRQNKLLQQRDIELFDGILRRGEL